jgi:hypothetical protein
MSLATEKKTLHIEVSLGNLKNKNEENMFIRKILNIIARTYSFKKLDAKFIS